MAGTENRCPSCRSAVSPHDARCGACGQVLGVDNVCERCHALAPVVQRGVRLLCTACGSERVRLPSTVVETEDQLAKRGARDKLKAKLSVGAAAALALFGVLVATLVGLFGQNAFEVAVALALGLLALAGAGLLARNVRRDRVRGEARERFLLEQRLMGFAYQRAGVVTAREVARHLNITVDAADAILDAMVTAQKADMDVTEQGEITFSVRSSLGTGSASQRSPAPRAAPVRRQTELP